jgi:hypothetical protein
MNKFASIEIETSSRRDSERILRREIIKRILPAGRIFPIQ